MNKTLEFEKQSIGVDWPLYYIALDEWEDYTLTATTLLAYAMECASKKSISTVQLIQLSKLEFNEFLKAISCKKSIESEKLIRLEESLSEFKAAHEMAKSRFEYDLSRLRKDGIFELDNEFTEALKEKYTFYTSSEQENKTLYSMNKLVEAINQLKQQRVITPYNKESLRSVTSALRFDKERREYILNPNLFQHKLINELAL